MARALIVGCGCRGRLLGERLLAEGWAVRGTSRGEARLVPIRETGIEPVLADPAMPGTILDLLGDVAVILWLLGSAEADGEEASALHGSKLERVLERLVETPVRGVVYEGAGSVGPDALASGRRAVESAAGTWRIPAEVVAADPADPEAWAGAMAAAVRRLVA